MARGDGIDIDEDDVLTIIAALKAWERNPENLRSSRERAHSIILKIDQRARQPARTRAERQRR